MELTLMHLFGTDAFQTLTSLIIEKSSLDGLTSSPNNRAEQLLAAILLNVCNTMQGVLVDEFMRSLVDENNKVLEFDNSELFIFLSALQWKVNFVSRNNAPQIKNTIVVFDYELVESE